MIPGGGRGRAIFRYCVEEELRKVVHREMLRREGLAPDEHSKSPKKSDGTWGGSWALDPKQETINRNKYHGLRRSSLCIINRLIAEALERGSLNRKRSNRHGALLSVIDTKSIVLPRQAARSFAVNVWVFPVLALAIADSRRNWNRLEALHLVKIGVPLRRIADLMDVPMVLRKVKPGVAHLAFSIPGIFAERARRA